MAETGCVADGTHHSDMTSTNFHHVEVPRRSVSLKCTKSADFFTHRCVGRTTAVRGSLVRALRVAAVVQLHRADEHGLGAEPYRLWGRAGKWNNPTAALRTTCALAHAACILQRDMGRYEIGQVAPPASAGALDVLLRFRRWSGSPRSLSDASDIANDELCRAGLQAQADWAYARQ